MLNKISGFGDIHAPSGVMDTDVEVSTRVLVGRKIGASNCIETFTPVTRATGLDKGSCATSKRDRFA